MLIIEQIGKVVTKVGKKCGIKSFGLMVAILIGMCCFGMARTEVSATSGALRKNSIKTCSDGLTYGQHGSNNHWHQAQYAPDVSSGWVAVGGVLASDPCPGESNGASGGSVLTEAAPTKSGETGILVVKVNGDEVSPVTDDMSYEAVIAKLNVTVVLADSKANYKINGEMAELGDDETRTLTIVVTAEDGSTKPYNLKIIRKMVQSAVRLENLSVKGETIDLKEDEDMSVTVPNSQRQLGLGYKLSEANAKMEVLRDDRVIDMATDELEVGENRFTLMVVDENKNKYKYTLVVYREDPDSSSIVVGAVVLCAIGGGVYYYNKKKNKKSQKLS